MPKLPHISGADAVRALGRLGFAQVRQRGSSGCVVPLSREINTGTLSGVLKQTGVSPDDFIAEL